MCFSLAIERLKGADDAFRKQLEDKIQSYKEMMTQMEHDKQTEIDQAYLRVTECLYDLYNINLIFF